MRQLQKTLLDTTAESRQTQGQLEEQLKQLENIRSSIKSRSQCRVREIMSDLYIPVTRRMCPTFFP